jgi:hypothetical protein
VWLYCRSTVHTLLYSRCCSLRTLQSESRTLRRAGLYVYDAFLETHACLLVCCCRCVVLLLAYPSLDLAVAAQIASTCCEIETTYRNFSLQTACRQSRARRVNLRRLRTAPSYLRPLFQDLPFWPLALESLCSRLSGLLSSFWLLTLRPSWCHTRFGRTTTRHRDVACTKNSVVDWIYCRPAVNSQKRMLFWKRATGSMHGK